ncbi:MAG: NAD(P)/FAD-dependent oxidoreductase [Candidatus Helarchaeota archaeon]|nr:NAD(P)/FAD-dependent oxidoreductase [Candidatus Helarchaeota archaeon]
MSPKIVIIGSGIGGSGIGALLAVSTNADIALFEKNTILGGRCASYDKKDDQGRSWKFDIGCHIFSTCNRGPLGEILHRCGKSLKWSYTRNPGPRVNVMGIELSSVTKTKKRKGKVKKEKKSFTDFVRSIPIEETDKYDTIPLIDLLNDFYGPNRGEINKLMYSMQAGVMFGTDPLSTSAGEFLRCIGDNARKMSMGYPIGGTGAIPEAYCDIIVEKGGQIYTGKNGLVKRIIVEDNNVKGVEAGPDDKFFEADIVIANSDIKTTGFKLIGEKYFSKDYVNYIQRLKWGGQVCSIKIGVDIIVTDQKMLTYVPKMDRQDMQGIFTSPDRIKDIDFTKLGVPKLTALLIVPISNHDPALAPDGCQNIHGVSPTAFGSMVKWSKADEKKWEQTCLNTLLTLWPEIEDHIVIQDFISTTLLNARFGKEGAGTGIAQSIDQVGNKRPSMISPIEGLYYCSGDAGGWGIGTELPARAALELFEIFKKKRILNFSN